jgi:hypothetical protein
LEENCGKNQSQLRLSMTQYSQIKISYVEQRYNLVRMKLLLLKLQLYLFVDVLRRQTTRDRRWFDNGFFIIKTTNKSK